MKTTTMLILICLGSPAISANLSGQEQQQIMTHVQQLQDAANAGQYAVAINLMPDQFYTLNKIPKATLLTVAQKVAKKLKNAGMKITGQYQKPVVAYQCKRSKIAFVRGKIHVEIQGKKFFTTGFIVASRNQNQNEWRFLDGSNPSTRRRAFYDSMFGCQGIKIDIPAYSMKQL